MAVETSLQEDSMSLSVGATVRSCQTFGSHPQRHSISGAFVTRMPPGPSYRSFRHHTAFQVAKRRARLWWTNVDVVYNSREFGEREETKPVQIFKMPHRPGLGR